MSEITQTDLAWNPPPFPARGRLPSEPLLVGQNCHRQNSAERNYRQELCLAAGRRVEPPCCKTLHISLFFDGTGNNLNNDFVLDNPRHPTNIARLFRATIGDGTAGGVTNSSQVPLDAAADSGGKYFKFYIPGVGTPFPEINDPDYTDSGLIGAMMGEERINWALLRILDVLKFTATEQWLTAGESRKSIGKMGTRWSLLWVGGSNNRDEEFNRLLNELAPRLKPLITQPEPGKPKLLGIKLYIYGFSRGAAAARAFVRWLSELLPPPLKEGDAPPQCLLVGGLQLPISIEFLGLLDTVASVGVAHVVPVAEGHMSWADDTMELPDDKIFKGLIKKCVHLVAGHEQRLSFPLDSVRRANGKYPPYAIEVVYPGVHSDIGGGYPPGDQGKGAGEGHKSGDLIDDSLLLSQIALHDMYAAAFDAGAPMKVPEGVLPDNLSSQNWRVMDAGVLSGYDIDTPLVNRFNAWRELTLNLDTPAEISPEEAAKYNPPRASGSLEKAVDIQIAWITAWRIGRYAKGTLLNTPFYQRATDTHAQAGPRTAAKEKRNEQQKQVLKYRQDQLVKQPADKMDELLLMPGVKGFDPDMAKTQLREAAQEFGEDYRGEFRTQLSIGQLILDTLPQHAIFLINSDDEGKEYRQIKHAGEALEEFLFPEAGENSNAGLPAGQVRALFDDQVHDSRAWFMHAALGSREMWASYFRHRMIYFADASNKSLSLLTVAGNVVGVATLVGGVVYSFRQPGVSGKLAGLAGTAGMMKMEAVALDRLTGEPLPLLSEAEQLRAFTREPGLLVARQKAAAAEQQLALAKAAIPASWLEKVQTASV